jgi:hypothetical protein
LRDRNPCVRVFGLCYRLARLDAITAPDGHGLNLRHFQRRELHKLPFHIANCKGLRAARCKKVGSERENTQDTHIDTPAF